ncbi:MAG: oligosaccharide flippase family protein [Candidatus Coatesbacteria bacterium]|nr:MAG: oligosaccharide flippase family protein [Candidatus Coatesbacteria bacterium]
MTEFGLTFAISVVLTRSLGPDLFGKYAIVMTFCGLFALLANFGFEETLNALIPKDSRDKTRQSSLFSSLLAFRIIILTVIAGLAFLLSDPISVIMKSPGLGDLIRLAIPFIFVANINALFMFLLTGLFRFGTLAFTKVLSLILQLIGISAVLASGGGIVGVIFVLFITNSALLLIYVFIGRSYINLRPRRIPIVPALSFGVAVWLTNLVNFALGKQSDIILLGLFNVAEAQIGYYEIAFRSVNTVNMLLISGFIGVTLASFAEASSKDETVLGDAWQLTVKAYGAIALPIILFSIIHARAIIIGVFSEAYEPAVVLFQTYASFMLLAKLLGGGNHITVLYATERQKTALAVRFAAGAVNVTLNLFLIPSLGVLGAFIATGISQLLVVTTELVIVKLRVIRAAFPIRFNVSLMSACLLGLIPGIIIRPTSLWGVTAAAVVYYLITVSVLYILKPLSGSDRTLLGKIDPLIGKLVRPFSTPAT